MQPKPQAEPDVTSWDDFCGQVLEIIAELSPCPEPTLFVIAATRGLQRFGDGTLDDLGKRLGRCVQELQARGLIQINEKSLVITLAESSEDEDILELTTVAGSPSDEEILELTTVAGTRTDEDILLLTSEIELHSSVQLFKIDKAPANKQQVQSQAQHLGDSEHTTEATREEIIAAMRRFISEQ